VLYTGLTCADNNAVVTRAFLAAAAIAALVVSPAPALPGPLVSSLFGPAMVRAELIVMDQGIPHDLRVDRGRITAVGAGSLRLLESDGTVVTMAVGSETAITVRGRFGRLGELRRGMNVTTVREGEGPARHVIQPALGMPRRLADLLYGARMVRAEAIVVQNGAPRLFRIDQGRIAAARDGMLRVRERDGTVVILPVSSAAQITVDGRPASFAELQRGMNAATVREGEAPAHIVAAGTR
jgi:hypothetical protein